jgi:hypothetical protein
MTEETRMAFRRVLLRRDTSSNWTSTNPTLAAGELGAESNTGRLKLGDGSTAWNGLAYLGGVTSVNGSTGVVVLNLDDVNNVTAPSPSNGDYLRWNGTAWVNVAGQAVATTSDVTFNDLTVSGNLTVNGTTTAINTSTLNVADNVVVLNNDVTGSPTENAGIEVERGTSTNVLLRWNETNDVWELTNDGTNYSPIATEGYVSTQTSTLDSLGDVAIASASDGQFLRWNGTAWVNDAIDLGTDTTGNYMTDLTAGTGVTITHTPSEGSNATIAIGQAVATNSEVTFSNVKSSSVIEVVTISATAATGTINIDVKNGTTYYTSNASANFTVNLRWDSSTSLDAKLAVGEMATTSFIVTNGATPYYANAHQIAGSAITPKWQGGSAPAAGNANSIDMYTYTVVKTASNTFTLFAALTRFA